MLAAAVLSSRPRPRAPIHTWDVREVFSNHDGTIQYVELFDAGAGGTETIGVGNGTLTSSLNTFSWTNGPVAPPTNGKSYLIATAAFAALPGRRRRTSSSPRPTCCSSIPPAIRSASARSTASSLAPSRPT
ncbi:MAG: hypothetical protein R3F21_08955 [Myxococcota bacterium]